MAVMLKSYDSLPVKPEFTKRIPSRHCSDNCSLYSIARNHQENYPKPASETPKEVLHWIKTCCKCSDPIGFARLSSQPTTVLCVRCKERFARKGRGRAAWGPKILGWVESRVARDATHQTFRNSVHPENPDETIGGFSGEGHVARPQS